MVKERCVHSVLSPICSQPIMSQRNLRYGGDPPTHPQRFQPQRWRLCSRGLTPARPSASFREDSIINLDSQVVCNRIEKQGYQPRYGVEHLSMEQVKAHSAAVLRSAGLQKNQIQAERYERSGPRSPYGNHCTRSKPSSLRD